MSLADKSPPARRLVLSAPAAPVRAIELVVPGSQSPVQRSGSPYFLRLGLEGVAAEQSLASVGSSPLPRVRRFPLSALAWCLRNRTRQSRAFLLSKPFIDAAARSEWGAGTTEADLVIMFGQIAPTRLRRPGGPVLVQVIDLTLLDYLEAYPELGGLPAAARRELVEDERASYADADMVACYTHEVKTDLMTRYGVPADKIVVCARGVNWEGPIDYVEPRILDGSPIHVGLIGADVARKGVRELAAGIDLYRDRTGEDVRLDIMGADGLEGFERPYVRWWGRIDKGAQRDQFVGFMAQTHIGALLSEAEGIPGSLYEFLYFGRPIIASSECRLDPAAVGENGVILTDRKDAGEVADAIGKLVGDLKQGRMPTPQDRSLTWEGVALRLMTAVRPCLGQARDRAA